MKKQMCHTWCSSLVVVISYTLTSCTQCVFPRDWVLVAAFETRPESMNRKRKLRRTALSHGASQQKKVLGMCLALGWACVQSRTFSTQSRHWTRPQTHTAWVCNSLDLHCPCEPFVGTGWSCGCVRIGPDNIFAHAHTHTHTHTEKVKNTIRQTGNHSLGI